MKYKKIGMYNELIQYIVEYEQDTIINVYYRHCSENDCYYYIKKYKNNGDIGNKYISIAVLKTGGTLVKLLNNMTWFNSDNFSYDYPTDADKEITYNNDFDKLIF